MSTLRAKVDDFFNPGPSTSAAQMLDTEGIDMHEDGHMKGFFEKTQATEPTEHLQRNILGEIEVDNKVYGGKKTTRDQLYAQQLEQEENPEDMDEGDNEESEEEYDDEESGEVEQSNDEELDELLETQFPQNDQTKLMDKLAQAEGDDEAEIDLALEKIKDDESDNEKLGTKR